MFFLAWFDIASQTPSVAATRKSQDEFKSNDCIWGTGEITWEIEFGFEYNLSVVIWESRMFQKYLFPRWFVHLGLEEEVAKAPSRDEHAANPANSREDNCFN